MEMLKTCLKIFILSRIFYAFIILICINQSFVREYDKSNYLMMSSFENKMDKLKNFHYFDEKQSERIITFYDTPYFERMLLKIFKNFNSYDTIHFMHNTRFGYTNEKNYVFFPLLSLVVGFMENLFMNVSLFTHHLTLFLIIGLFMSNMICCINGILFIR